MADVTGALHHDFGGKTYTLRLTLGGISKLQGKYGNDLGGLLDGGIEGVPPFGMMIDIIAAALEKGERISADDAADLADDMLTADRSIMEKVMKAAFPDQVGNAQAPKAKT
ncbi:hypothetical protein SAMN04489859_102174 [Paracoccus alcaliphilus]|uniref:Phage tail assembly chaperone protein, TAC n=1 Tax=Paracoccus alcaliphilus TaxID=34002 RepID=A0A1H8KDI4_9RHOB|nr:GTA-gp10 family protein [Paracoccus alcaliphilus]WCR17096.1 hypothetical protein JHW40_11930 [Paracoccus alcaliphilus]SEN90721.1 hypothetical protein SAMN04489859_102174 [Paracoccus alcaliphilus]